MALTHAPGGEEARGHGAGFVLETPGGPGVAQPGWPEDAGSFDDRRLDPGAPWNGPVPR